jgi:hypothetical protein
MIQQEPWWKNNSLMLKICLGFYAVAFSLCILLSKGTFGGGDSWMHYLFAHYAFRHPANFIDQWAKPVFTILSSPFAWFGFTGMQIFNASCALCCAYFSYRIAKHINPDMAWLSVIFVCSIPYFFGAALSGLTEVLFALFIILGVFLWQIKKESAALLLISFLPFVRSEGFLIIPVFGFMALLSRKYKVIPWLLSGSVLFSIIGRVAGFNWNWIFSSNPYVKVSGSPYGHGPLFHFVEANESIAGVPQVLLFIIAIILLAVRFRQSKNDARYRLISILILGSFAAYFIGHSIFWRLGIFGSAGLARVMAGIAPCIALLAFYAFQFLIGFPLRYLLWKRIALVIIVIWIMIIPLKQHQAVIGYSELEALQVKTADWISEQNIDRGFIYYCDPFVAVSFRIDPFDTMLSKSLFNGFEPNAMPDASLIIWDNHFGPHECRLPLSVLTGNSNFKLLHTEFIPHSGDQHGDILQVKLFQVHR